MGIRLPSYSYSSKFLDNRTEREFGLRFADFITGVLKDLKIKDESASDKTRGVVWAVEILYGFSQSVTQRFAKLCAKVLAEDTREKKAQNCGYYGFRFMFINSEAVLISPHRSQKSVKSVAKKRRWFLSEIHKLVVLGKNL